MDYRKNVEHDLNMNFRRYMRDSAEQTQTIQSVQESMKNRLGSHAEFLAGKLIPSYPFGCRRNCPSPNYLETLTLDKVHVITESISKFTSRGIKVVDGSEEKFDAVVCATGFDTTYRPRIKVIGCENVNLAEKWSDHPTAYLSTMVDGFPNYFMVAGPNFTVANGSLTASIQAQCEYIVKIIEKIQSQGIKSMSPRADVIKDLWAHIQEYHKRTVWSSSCKSWYKGGTSDGPVTAIWAGSAVHYMLVVSQPRWEDFNYEYLENRWSYLGNGFTKLDADNLDTSFYLTDSWEEYTKVALNLDSK